VAPTQIIFYRETFVISTHGIPYWIVRTGLWTSPGGRIRNGSFGFVPDSPEDQSLNRPSIFTACFSAEVVTENYTGVYPGAYPLLADNPTL
jgi:hypothetical protein